MEWNTLASRIIETDYDYDLKMYAVYMITDMLDEILIGYIVPETLEDMEMIKENLNTGLCPIEDNWELNFQSA